MKGSATENDTLQSLLAERALLQQMIATTPATAVLTRMSEEARLRRVEAQIAALTDSAP